MQELLWNGHANFQIKTPTVTFLVDPFFEGNPKAPKSWKNAKPDAVFITHDHGDHTGSVVEICKATGAKLGAIVGTAEKLAREGVPQEQILNGIGFNIGGTITLEGIRVTMTQAYHSSDSGAPAGYIFQLDDGYTVFHAGDTGIFSEMELWGRLYDIDLALLPVGGVFTMDAKQAALACQLLKCKGVVPMHWGTFPVLEQNTKNFAYQLQNYAPDCRLYDLIPGGTLKLEKTDADTCKC